MDDEPVHGVMKTQNELRNAEHNAFFVAHARTDLPAVVRELQEARELLKMCHPLAANAGEKQPELGRGGRSASVYAEICGT